MRLAPRALRPNPARLAPCSPPSRRGLEAPQLAARGTRRPTLTAAVRGAPQRLRSGRRSGAWPSPAAKAGKLAGADGVIDRSQDTRHSVGPSGTLKAAVLFGTRVADPIWASGHRRPLQTGRTYDRKRSDRTYPQKFLQPRGRPHMGPRFRGDDNRKRLANIRALLQRILPNRLHPADGVNVSRIGAAPLSEGAFLHAPSVQQPRQAVVSLEAAWLVVD